MSGFTSPVQILFQKTVALSFTCLGKNPEEPESESSSVSVSTNFEDSPNVGYKGPDGRFCGCVLTVESTWTDTKNGTDVCKAVCQIHGLIIALSSALEEMSEEQIVSFLHANAVSLFYGKARSLIEGMSAESLVGKKTLIAIDPYAYLDSTDEGSE